MNINTKATSGHHYHEHVHHHHHRHHKDDVESFKQQSLRVRKRRKMISRVLFVTLSILAAINHHCMRGKQLAFLRLVAVAAFAPPLTRRC